MTTDTTPTTATVDRPRRTCRSRSSFGDCGLASGHGGDHAVPIGDGVWFGYERGGRISVGYGKFVDDEWVALS